MSDGAELSGSDTVAMLCPSQYYVLVTDAYGCEANYNFSVANPQPPQVSKEVVHTPCDDVCMGSITIDMSAYEGECSYLWQDNNSTSPSRTNLCEDTYIARITYDGVCTIYDTTVIQHTTNLKLSKSVSPVCDIIIENIRREGKVGYGYDAATDTYGIMTEKGIVDPTKVTRCALQNAASVAAMVLTTESIVADIPKPEPAAPDMGGAGMGGMY